MKKHVTHGKVYKIDKHGHPHHIGEIHGGFLQFLPMLASVLGPSVGHLLSGVTKKIFGEGKYHIEHQNNMYELPDTDVHKKGGTGIFDILSAPFRFISHALMGEGKKHKKYHGMGSSFGGETLGEGSSFGSGSN